MALFKDVKKPVIRQSPRAADISPLRPKFVLKQPPCGVSCGAGSDVRAWVTVIAQAEAYGRSPDEAYEAAWRILAHAHPFPATLGRICPASCEQACHRGAREGAVAINALERWLGDVALARGFALPELERRGRVGRIAVVGAGAAGLSCAYQLARRGHQVTVFEAREVAGGRLRDAIRSGRLAAGILDAEIARLVRMGITLRSKTTVAPDLTDLDQDYEFVFVATGRGSSVAEDAAVRPGLFKGGDAVHPGLVSAALASGRLAAEAIHAAIDGTPLASLALPAIAVERLVLGWYEQAERGQWPFEPDVRAAGDATAEHEAWGDANILAEAKRCMSCGLCMDCERCWMYCTNNCFEKLPKGEHYRVNVDSCNGCRKCADECPCGYIDMV